MAFRNGREQIVVWAFALGLALVGASMLRADDEDDDPKRLPGLVGTYSASSPAGEIRFQRYDDSPALILKGGETPDPRLPAKGWKVEWKGVLEIKSPGKYRFSGEASGDAELLVGGKPVLKLAEGKPGTVVEGAELELSFGLQPVEIRFTQRGEGARLRLSWQSEDFQREPLPAFAVGHAATAAKVVDHFSAGRLAAEEHSCVACHKPSGDAPISAQLITRAGPRLTEAGARLTNRSWIYHWLKDPQALRPEAVMPRMFSDDARGAAERFAVATFLASRGKPPKARDLNAGERANWPKDGQALYEALGCVVCHEKHGEQGPRATLRQLRQKTTTESLAAFIQNPGQVDPAGRMPQFSFRNGEEPFKIALYLMARDAAAADSKLGEFPQPKPEEVREAYLATKPPAADAEKFVAKPPEEQLVELGRRVMREKRCTACHEVKIPGEDEFWKPGAAESSFASVAKKRSGGCLGPAGEQPKNGVPAFGATLAREAIISFLKDAVTAPATPAPGELAKLTLERLNCTGCHQRNGAGGLPEPLVAKMLANQTEQNAEAVSPPPLTGIAEKLLAGSIKQVLEGNQRSRPWMGLQMPRFDGQHMSKLPESLAAADGDSLRTDEFKPAADAALIEAGRQLVGDKGYSCTKCHDMFGIASLGTRGPDLANVTQRVSYDWYTHWMTDPQRLQPGTRMPTVFFGGKSSYPNILGGDPEKQKLAMWQYLLVCRSLPYPDGLQPPQKLRFPPADFVQVVRTFLPDTSARAIAIRNPNGIHLAYDAQACRLSYGWTGEFLDMRPVWDGRGGNKAGIEGSVFWTGPAGFPWEVTPSAEPLPDFSKRGDDTTLGAVAPQDGKLYPTRLNFRSYKGAKDRTTFHYDLDLGEGKSAGFSETVSTFRQGLATGVSREATVNVPGGRLVWLNAALADQPPEWQAAGSSGVLDGETKAAPGNAAIKIVQGGKRLVLHARGASPGAEWLAAKRGNTWSVMLRLPSSGQPPAAKVNLVVLKPLDDQAATTDRVVSEELGAK